MLYLLLVLGIIAVALAAVGCWLASEVHREVIKQREAIERIRLELDGHWKGANYFHAQTRALIQGQPPPNRSDYWT